MALSASVITKLFDNSITVHGLLKDDKNEVKIDTRFILSHRELEMEHKQANDDSESDKFNDIYPIENMSRSETFPLIERPSQHDEHTRALVHQSDVEGIAGGCDWLYLQQSTDPLIKDGILDTDVVNSPTFTRSQMFTSNDTVDVNVKARTQRINGLNTNSSVCSEASLKDDQDNMSEDDYIGGTAAICPIQMTSDLECDSPSVPGVEALVPDDSAKMNSTLHPQDMTQCLQTDAIDSPVNIALNEAYNRLHTVEVHTAGQPNQDDSAGLNCFSTVVKNIVSKFNKKCEGTSSSSFEDQRNGASKENVPVIDPESQNIVDSIHGYRSSLNSVTVTDCTRDKHSCERQPVPEMTFLHFLASIPQYRCVLTHNLVTIILAMKFQRIQYFIYLDLLIYALYLASLSCFMFSGFECLASENSSETSMMCSRLLEQCQNITQNNNLCSHLDAMCSTDSLTCSIDWGKKRWPWSATCVWAFLALVIMRDVIIWISKITFWSQCQNLQCVTYKQKSHCQNLRCFFHKLKTTFYNWCFVLKLIRTALTVLILIQTQNKTTWNELTTLVIYFACLELVMIATHVPKVAEFARMPVVAAKNISIYGIIYFILTLGMFSCLFINQHLYQGKSVENMSGFSYNPGVWVQSIMAQGFDVSHLFFISVLAFIFLMGINLLNTLLANNIKNDLMEKCEKGAILVIIEFLYDFEHFVFQIGNKWLIHKVLLSSPKQHFTEFDNYGNSTFYFRNGVDKRYDMDLNMYLTICGKSSIPPQKLLATQLEEKFKSMQKSLDSSFDEIHFRLAEIEEKMAIHTTKCE